MKITAKKIIAREILLLVGILTISLITFLLAYPYNHYLNSKINRIQDTIAKVNKEKDSLQNTYKKKTYVREQFYSNLSKTFNFKQWNTTNLFWIRSEVLMKKDSFEYIYTKAGNENFREQLKNLGYKNYKEFSDFIKANSLTKNDRSNMLKVANIETRLGFKPTFNQDLPYEDKYDQLFETDKEISSFDELLHSGTLSYLKQMQIIEEERYSTTEQINLGLNCLLILALIAYPIRGIILLVIWSIKTLKKGAI